MAQPQLDSPIPPLSSRTVAKAARRTNKAESAEAVELAGTPESETCLIPSTEEDIEHYAYLFTVRYTEDGVRLDHWIDITCVTGVENEAVVAKHRAYAKLTNKELAPEKFTEEQNSVLRQVSFLVNLRMRFDSNSYGPYKISTTAELPFNTLDDYLRNLSSDDLKTFLKGAKI